ncbi:hypothetical protein BJX61DRAFT_538634 [Aspergillus egyptiacus]|nr:hypothetical protein BJX61DRAFT_538634 [Aspergillus egyptiacus]
MARIIYAPDPSTPPVCPSCTCPSSDNCLFCTTPIDLDSLLTRLSEIDIKSPPPCVLFLLQLIHTLNLPSHPDSGYADLTPPPTGQHHPCARIRTADKPRIDAILKEVQERMTAHVKENLARHRAWIEGMMARGVRRLESEEREHWEFLEREGWERSLRRIHRVRWRELREGMWRVIVTWTYYLGEGEAKTEGEEVKVKAEGV